MPQEELGNMNATDLLYADLDQMWTPSWTVWNSAHALHDKPLD